MNYPYRSSGAGRWSRRDFFGAMAGAYCMPSLMVPPALGNVASEEPLLIIVNLVGGNDSLNTLVPHDSPTYHSARPNLGMSNSVTLPLTAGPDPTTVFGLHPALINIQREWNNGSAAFINKVGYQGANQSHFASRDIWSRGYVDYAKWTWPESGWIARYKDLFARERYGVIGLRMGGLKDFSGGETEAVTLQSVLDLSPIKIDRRFPNNSRYRNQIVKQVLANHTNSPISTEVSAVMREALELVEELNREVSNYQQRGGYPLSDIGESFRDLAIILSVGLPLRVAYLTLDGFDTHAYQKETQGGLLQALDQSIGAFAADMRLRGHWNRIVIAVISEFGRRTRETSTGTDHGFAGAVTLLGGGVNGGIYGDAISETDLRADSLPFATDFREVYWELLEGHMKVDPKDVFKVMPGAVSPLGFV